MGTFLNATNSEATIQPTLVLDKNSFVPYYRQIFEQVRELVESEKVRSGSSFWSEGDLARDLGISKMTVRQAFQALRADGLLIIEKGRWPLVGRRRIYKNFQELRGFSEEMSRRGLKASSQLLAAECGQPDAETRRALRLDDNEKICRIQRLRFADEELIGLETSNLPARIFAGLERQDLEKQSLYSLLESRYGVKLEWSEEILEAIKARSKDAKLLRVKPGSPLFSMRRTVYSDHDAPIEHGLSLFRGDRYRATVISHRKP